MKATSSLVPPARLENLQAFMETAKETAAAGLGPKKVFRPELALEDPSSTSSTTPTKEAKAKSASCARPMITARSSRRLPIRDVPS
jgi:hypothetical protein